MHETIISVFSNENSIKTFRAHKVLLQNLCMNDELLQIMENSITKNQSDLIIYRICSIIEKYSKNYPTLVSEKFCFITKLLLHSDKSSVTDLFRKFSVDTLYDMMETRFLQCLDIPGLILNLIRGINDNTEGKKYNEIEENGKETLKLEEDAYCIAGIFNLITIFSDNDFLRVRFQTDTALFVITRTFSSYVIPVLNAQWNAILNLFDENTFSFFENIIPLAIENIDYRIEKYSEFQTFSIDFLHQIITKDPKYIRYFIENHIFDHLFSAMCDFPLHTILHQSVIKLMIQGLKTDFVGDIINSFLPFAAEKFRFSETEVLHASCLNILHEINQTILGSNAIRTIEGLEIELKPLFDLLNLAKIAAKSISPSREVLFREKKLF